MEYNQQVKKWGLALEGLLLFVGIPLLTFWELIPIPKILMLILVAAYCAYQLWEDPDFGRGLLKQGFFKKEPETNAPQTLLVRTPIIVAAIVTLVLVLHPERLFAFPAERPIFWAVVMLLYPILSALPQEFIYRTFFFHRYEDFIPTNFASVFWSAAAFSFMHIIYDNWWAIGISFIGGLLFGVTYSRTKSLFWVTVEHAIYGCLIFTLGMGMYFYEPF